MDISGACTLQEELYNAIVANDVARAYDKIEDGADVSGCTYNPVE